MVVLRPIKQQLDNSDDQHHRGNSKVVGVELNGVIHCFPSLTCQAVAKIGGRFDWLAELRLGGISSGFLERSKRRQYMEMSPYWMSAFARIVIQRFKVHTVQLMHQV
jgi:hypothetical protein